MKRSMVLPFKESIISYTPNMDHFLSVLENQHEVTYPWILENYIDLIIRKDGQNPSVFEFLDYNKIWWTCPFIHVSRIERQAFAVYGDIQDAIISLLEKGFYLFFLVDTFYIENYATYNKKHIMHDIFVYGYEDDCVYACDYFDFRKKSKVKIAFSCLRDGYQNVPKLWDYGRGVVLFKDEDISDNISLYQYKESLSGKLDVEKIGYSMDCRLVRIKLERFLESPEYVNSVTPTFFDYRLGYTTGFKVFEVLGDAMVRQGDVTPKDIHLICCHVKLMTERVRYLKQNVVDERLGILEKTLGEVAKEIELVKYLLMKDMIKKVKSFEKIIPHYNRFLSLYNDALVRFDDCLKDYEIQIR